MTEQTKINVGTTTSATRAYAAERAVAALAPPEGYVPLTAEGLLLFCQSRLQEMDTDIQKKMKNQEQLVGLQRSLGGLAAMIKVGGPGGDENVAFKDEATVNKLSGEIQKSIDQANACGNKELAAQLQGVMTKLNAGAGATVDVLVTKEEVKEMCGTLDEALASCRSGAELSMIELQSLVSKRATMLQLTTNLMNTVNEGIKSIAANIGRS